ncbi:hypothetical protein PGT21_030670 [Puccinia graminis f. sp. tritici]|uniref:Uncharacterized protein n=1 Tax=Puccinia graminis f. sp. tritici TaxID=56615 RepID=A0A5B0QZ14_PUCGR|nr:hypothetical protein PGT21_030670 [Puccinia graminis f. sp. tritici]
MLNLSQSNAVNLKSKQALAFEKTKILTYTYSTSSTPHESITTPLHSISNMLETLHISSWLLQLVYTRSLLLVSDPYHFLGIT